MVLVRISSTFMEVGGALVVYWPRNAVKINSVLIRYEPMVVQYELNDAINIQVKHYHDNWLPGGKLEPNLPSDRQGYLTLYYRGANLTWLYQVLYRVIPSIVDVLSHQPNC